MEDWYEPDIFRGHVREPSARDLNYIAKDINLANPTIIGRNWTAGAGKIMRVIDYALRPFPSLCSDLYLIGVKRT